jgi:hypothetical protein
MPHLYIFVVFSSRMGGRGWGRGGLGLGVSM